MAKKGKANPCDRRYTREDFEYGKFRDILEYAETLEAKEDLLKIINYLIVECNCKTTLNNYMLNNWGLKKFDTEKQH